MKKKRLHLTPLEFLKINNLIAKLLINIFLTKKKGKL